MSELSILSNTHHRWTDGRRLLSAGEEGATAVFADDGRAMSYGQLREEARRLGEAFGAGKKLILIVAGNDVDTVATYAAALHSGHAVVLVAPEPAGLIDHVCEHYRPNFLCHHVGGEWRVEQRHSGQLALHPELACLLSTSGTTGEGKFVRLSYRNLLSNALAIVEYLGIGKEDRFLLNLPINYSYGLSILNSHLVAGACLLASERSVTEPALWEFFRRHRGSGFAGVPHTYKLLEASKFENLDLPDLRTMTQAGGRLPEPLARRFAQWAGEHGVRFYIMYGQTEASPRIAYLPPELAISHPDCIGRPIPGGTIELVGSDGTPVEGIGEVGELQYSGPNVMMGYATRLADLAEPPGPPVLRTGDMAMRTADGLFKITGREKRFLKIYGLRISLDEIERRLEADSVRALCSGSDEFLGVMTTDDRVPAEGLIARVSQVSGLPPTVIEVLRVGEFPLLPSGKVDFRRVGRALAEARQARLKTAAGPGTPTDAGESIASRIEGVFRENFPGKEVSGGDSFASLGGDSLGYVAVSLGLEEVLRTLPPHWEKLSIEELAESSAQARGGSQEMHHGRGVESSVLVRALAPLLVVMSHEGLDIILGGAALLLVVVGMNYSRFQLPQILEGRARQVFLNFLANVLLPYWLILTAYEVTTGEASAADFLLYGNMDDEYQRFLPFATWFVEAVAQMFVVVWLVLLFMPARRYAASEPYRFGLVLLLASMAAHVMESLYFPALKVNWGGELPWIAWLFALGMAMAHADGRWQKGLVTMLALVLPQVFYRDEPSRQIVIGLGCLFLIWVPRVVLPNAVASVVAVLASASLYIYMLHLFAPTDSWTADWTLDIVRILIGVSYGIIGWWCYTSAQSLIKSAIAKWRRPDTAAGCADGHRKTALMTYPQAEPAISDKDDRTKGD